MNLQNKKTNNIENNNIQEQKNILESSIPPSKIKHNHHKQSLEKSSYKLVKKLTKKINLVNFHQVFYYISTPTLSSLYKTNDKDLEVL